VGLLAALPLPVQAQEPTTDVVPPPEGISLDRWLNTPDWLELFNGNPSWAK
jgi:hypothetical protein